MKSLLLLGSFLFLLFWGFVFNVYAGQTYYVSTQGSNSNNGSFNAPWRNLEFAVTIARAGDTIIMRGGTHIVDEVFIDRNKGRGGAPGQYLTIKAFAGEEPILQPNSRWLLIWADYVRVEGLHFIMPWRCDAYGVGLQIINNKFTGPQPQFGAIQTGGSDILIEGNLIQYDDMGGNSHDHGIYVQRGKRITIRNNRIFSARGYGIHVFDEHKSSNPADWAANPFVIKDYLIEGNYIEGCQLRSGIIIAKGRGGNYINLENITVRNNVSVGNPEFGLLIREGQNITVYNNTFYFNGIASLWIREPSTGLGPARNITIKNNIFVAGPQRAHVGNRSSGRNIVLENNLYERSPVFLGISDAKIIVDDPLFMDPATRDFHLQASSPAIDAGVNVGLAFAGAAPDLGAFEFGDPTSVEQPGNQPEIFSLHQNYPNPFNPETTIVYEVISPSKIAIYIYNVLGQKVRTLLDKESNPGSFSVKWNGKNHLGESVASGVYFYKLEVKSKNDTRIFSETKKMLLLR